MSDFQEIADRSEIAALPGEFTDAGMMRDYDRLASLFAPGGVVRIPHVNIEVAREELHAWVDKLESWWEYFFQTTHAGTIMLQGDTAVGRSYITEFGRMRNGGSHMNYGIYHDRYRRFSEGWKFTERVYELRYVDTTPLNGSAPRPTEDASMAPGSGLSRGE